MCAIFACFLGVCVCLCFFCGSSFVVCCVLCVVSGLLCVEYCLLCVVVVCCLWYAVCVCFLDFLSHVSRLFCLDVCSSS